MKTSYSPVVLAVIDGMGVAPASEGNVVTAADTPNLDKYWPSYPHTMLIASGEQVGLQVGEPGNTAFGHRMMGAGRILPSMKNQIDKAIEENTFAENPVIEGAFQHVIKNDTCMHVVVCFGENELQADLGHLQEVIKIAVNSKLDPDSFFVHLVGLDGSSAPEVIQTITDMCISKHMGKVASVMGAQFAMDTGYNWELTAVAYDAFIHSRAHVIMDVNKKLSKHYKQKQEDDSLEPIQMVLHEHDIPAEFSPGDAVLFCNFDNSGFGQLVESLQPGEFNYFERPNHPQNLYIASLTPVAENMPPNVAFKPLAVPNHVGEVLHQSKIRQARIAEADKFAAVTYFFDQMQAAPLAGQTYIEVPAGDRDLVGLNNHIVTEIALQKISEGYQFILLNFSAVDIHAHSGDIEATKGAVNFIDKQIGILAEAILAQDGCLLITSDHGNAEKMLHHSENTPHTTHTNNLVPFMAIGPGLLASELQQGTLADIGPTVLELLGVEVPADMTGRNLLYL